MLTRFTALIRSVTLALAVVMSHVELGHTETTPAPQATPVSQSLEAAVYRPSVAAVEYGTMSQYWEYVCTVGVSTNFLDVIVRIIGLIEDLSERIFNLGAVLSVNFEVGDISACLPGNIQLPNLQLPGVEGLLGCFTALPDLSGIFGNMASCVGGVVATFPNLSGFLNSFDLSSLLSCLQTQLPQGSISVSIPDLLGNIIDLIDEIMDLLNSIRLTIPIINDIFRWQAVICDSLQIDGGAQTGFPMSGASYAMSSNAAQGGVTVGFQFAAPPPAASAVGTMAAAAANPQVKSVKSVAVIVSSKRKIVRLRGADGQTRQVRLMKSLALRPNGTSSFRGKIDYRRLKLPKGSYRYTYLATMQDGIPVPVGGGTFEVTRDYSK